MIAKHELPLLINDSEDPPRDPLRVQDNEEIENDFIYLCQEMNKVKALSLASSRGEIIGW